MKQLFQNIALAGVCALGMASAAMAQECVPYFDGDNVPGTLIVRYHADFSEVDHFNSKGDRLTSAAAVLQQDRANVHKFGKATAYDEKDGYFTTLAHRQQLGAATVTSFCHSDPADVRRGLVDHSSAGTVWFFRPYGGGYVALVDLAG